MNCIPYMLRICQLGTFRAMATNVGKRCQMFEIRIHTRKWRIAAWCIKGMSILIHVGYDHVTGAEFTIGTFVPYVPEIPRVRGRRSVRT